MNKLPDQERAFFIRTDFSDQDVWENIVLDVKAHQDLASFNMEILDERVFDGASKEKIIASFSDKSEHIFVVLADRTAMDDPEHPLLVVDLYDEPGQEFRAIPASIATIDSNLSTANMDYEEFADGVEDDCVFRGFGEE